MLLDNNRLKSKCQCKTIPRPGFILKKGLITSRQDHSAHSSLKMSYTVIVITKLRPLTQCSLVIGLDNKAQQIHISNIIIASDILN